MVVGSPPVRVVVVGRNFGVGRRRVRRDVGRVDARRREHLQSNGSATYGPANLYGWMQRWSELHAASWFHYILWWGGGGRTGSVRASAVTAA